MNLRIAKDLVLPLEATTQAIGIVAKRRVGKSYTARRFAEQLLHAGQQLVIVDPKGDWWGIRSSADGKAPGYPVVILGGEHQDVPLEVHSGEVVAKLVVEERVSVLLDLSSFRKSEVKVFMADFLETLYRLKAKEANRTPVMVIVDEADAIFPQKPQPGEERMLGAGEDIVRRGGQRGIGCMMITQRTAVLNKNVLTQCEMLIALRTISPQDLKAMQAWIDVHGSEEERDTLMESLPSLPVGEAWVWSPGWPTAEGIFQRVKVLPIETFDSGATPTSGAKRVEPKTVADVDLGALTRQMAATIERAKADDPKELKKRIAELEKSITVRADEGFSADRVNALMADEYKRGYGDAIESATTGFGALAATAHYLSQQADLAHEIVTRVKGIADDMLRETRDARAQREIAQTTAAPSAPTFRPPTPTSSYTTLEPPRRQPVKREPVDGVNPSEQKLLDALALMERIRVPFTKTNLGFFTGYTEGGRFNNLIGGLRTKGLIEAARNDGTVEPTDAGRAIALADSAPIRSLRDLHALWLSKLSPSEAKVLEVVLSMYPGTIDKERLGELTNYSEGGRFNNILGRLRSLGAIDYPRPGHVAATDAMFPKGLR